LTVVCGRNGSGKSTFAEALEVLLTGQLRRWETHSLVFREGWRSMHASHARVRAELFIEGTAGATVVERDWPDDTQDVGKSVAWVQRPREAKTTLKELGWDGPLSSYRPFLSHSELETLLAQPKDLYNQLNSLLGLDDLETAAKRLGSARRDTEAEVRAAKVAQDVLESALGGCEDERAVRALALLRGKTTDLAALDHLAAGATGPDGGELALLGQLAALAAPGEEPTTTVVAALRQAAAQVEAARSESAAQAASMVGMLDQALAHYREQGPGACPVCETPGKLDEKWRAAAEKRLEALRKVAEALTTAERAAQRAITDARALVSQPPGILQRASDFGVDAGPTLALWLQWAGLPIGSGSEDLSALARHLELSGPTLVASVTNVARQANAEISAREHRWSPLAAELRDWCAKAKQADVAKANVAKAKRAEDWLKLANADLRDEQLRPFADRTIALWAELRQESNVELLRMRLAGTANRSHVNFEVTVDGKPAAGLGVMSQGEVNALALSVFLPRATSSRSPLRFVVIDDPVQAMDPAKVAGLARVLAEAGRTRQVVVFTHDDRLPAAVRDLELPARILQVQRRAGSDVDISPAGDPCAQLLADAGALAAGDRVPAPVASCVVPGICRTALEAACIELTRRRRLARGDAQADVEASVESTKKLLPKLALAVLDDAGRVGEVYAWLNRNIGAWAADTVTACNAGAHSASADMGGLVGDTRRLIERLRDRAG
jgi:recombinational DNA repair ATPase RecF